MYNWKDLAKGAITFTLMMSLLAGFLVLNGLHYAGAFQFIQHTNKNQASILFRRFFLDINKRLRYIINVATHYTQTHTRRNTMSKVETTYGETILKQTQEIADMFKSAMPKVTTNKNGYELRTKVLEMAQNQTWQDYHAKLGAFETTVTKEGDEVVTTVTMPEVPGVDAVMEAADKFYAFVNGKPNK